MRPTVTRRLLTPRSISRLVLHALAAALLSGALLLVLDWTFRLPVASGLYLLTTPGVTALIAALYFRQPDHAEPLIAAVSFAAVAGGLDLAMATIARGQVDLIDPVVGFGLPLILVLGATGLTGELVPMLRRRET
jgi:hypothetical protein